MNHLPVPETGADTAPATAAPAGRRQYRGLHLVGLVGCVSLMLWCHHWLNNAHLSDLDGKPAETSRYILALVLVLPAISGFCFFGQRLWRGRWLLWLALVLLCTECAVLVGTFLLICFVGTGTTWQTMLLALGVAACVAAGFGVWRQLRRPR
ncbi:hypothetical protein F0P96_06070 [Hymenobacter busanensis]|uniref:Uncharacterized protein n=1 Tax=Hymenobacter busanensis TaxID=2607656 RepID=A0A7L5A065_9BACT|nr:hypothetical protein [Hymenobacter busanensis]KAA9338399.1 hypothetical protein F0P96_06070 [Hymenobacter busanensis]QHJ09174.1 hypothetical protein GUY19_18535 [Hymenobacter busanensis]